MFNVGSCLLEIVQGDITDQEVDAIVNAANSRLAGGGGVDGAIHRRGGPSIMAETESTYPNGCPTGSAVISGGGDLPAKYVIHTVGPVWRGGDCGEPEKLASAYQSSLRLAVEHQCQSIAFPAISCGVYGYPIHLAAKQAIDTTVEFAQKNNAPLRVRFVLFNGPMFSAFVKAASTRLD